MGCTIAVLGGTIFTADATALGEEAMIFVDGDWIKGLHLICVGDTLDSYYWTEYSAAQLEGVVNTSVSIADEAILLMMGKSEGRYGTKAERN